MENKHTRRGFTQNIQWVGETLSHKDNLASSPLVGEVARSAEGGSAIKEHLLNTLLPRLTAVLPPQGREIKAQGFTLIELLVVVLIIGILAAVAVPQYQKAVEKSKFMEKIVWLRQIYHAEKMYYLQNGSYESRIENLAIDWPAGTQLKTEKVILPNGTDFKYNTNNNCIQFYHNEVFNNFCLSNGEVNCYHMADSTAKKICKQVQQAGYTCGPNACTLIDFEK